MGKPQISMRTCSLMEGKDNSVIILGRRELCKEVKQFLIREEYIFKGFNIPGANQFGIEVHFTNDYDIEAFREKWDTACKVSSQKLERIAERS